MQGRKTFTALACCGLLAAVAGTAVPSRAHAYMVQGTCDSVSSGGWLFVSPTSSAWATWSANAGCRNGRLSGSVVYEDHLSNFHLNSTEITGYLVDPSRPNARDICGRARVNGSAIEVRFRVHVEDNGEPGRGSDRFAIVIDNWHSPDRFYVASGTVWGNVQLHKASGRDTLPAAPEWSTCGDLPSP